MSALAKDPAQRPQSAAGFASALRASSEGPTHLLRQAFALYSEHFPTVLKISLLGYAPFAVLALLNLADFIDGETLSQPQHAPFATMSFISGRDAKLLRQADPRPCLW